jgi:hypothetical protein
MMRKDFTKIKNPQKKLKNYRLENLVGYNS